ncbi:DUF305 domain-containing protein [Streptomyces sp. NPDC002573]|uniref:DUF305 domain-containing protein n=1 Tax=Streptomyces sp. NPDC002573 TaxID=3364651 RepID=UPI0036C0B298
MFLTMMIEHHQGAVKMAATEKQQGAYEPAKDMANKIATTQTAQINQMRTMLAASTPSSRRQVTSPGHRLVPTDFGARSHPLSPAHCRSRRQSSTCRPKRDHAAADRHCGGTGRPGEGGRVGGQEQPGCVDFTVSRESCPLSGRRCRAGCQRRPSSGRRRGR